MTSPRWLLGALLALPACHPSTPTMPPNDAVDDDATTDALSPDVAPEVSLADAVDAVDTVDVVIPATPPRLVAPVSGSVVRTARPTLRWSMSPGDHARVELCESRACAAPTSAFDADGDHATPPADLAPGPHWFRVRTSGGTSAVGELFVERAAHAVDGAARVQADFDSDGLADLVVGANYDDLGAGKVYVYYGAPGGLSVRAVTELRTGSSDPAQFGSTVASVGDVDGDGFGDLLVGSVNAQDSVGRIDWYRGGASGIATSPASTVTGLATRDEFGEAVSAAGDVNGDGFADVIVGAPGAAGSAGVVTVFYGDVHGVSREHSLALTAPDGVSSAFGIAVAGGADVNGDGFSDVIVGASGAVGGAGRAYVYLGGAMGLSSRPAATLSPADARTTQFGGTVALIAGLDGDAYADAVVGASAMTDGAGRMSLFAGGPNGVASTALAVRDGPDGDQGAFGWAIAGTGDLDGDGLADLVVGATCAPFTSPTGQYPGCGAGRAYVYAGAAGTGLSSAPAVTLVGSVMDDQFGWAVAGIGDVDGDGHNEVAIGAHSAMYYGGVVTVFHGGASGIESAPWWTQMGPGGAGANFGWSLALRSNTRVRHRARCGA